MRLLAVLHDWITLYIYKYIVFHGRQHFLGGSDQPRMYGRLRIKVEGDKMGDFWCGEWRLEAATLYEAPSVCVSRSPRVLHRCTSFNKDGYQCRAAEQSHLVNKRRAALSKGSERFFQRKTFHLFLEKLASMQTILYSHESGTHLMMFSLATELRRLASVRMLTCTVAFCYEPY